jgi:beta-glucosidase
MMRALSIQSVALAVCLSLLGPAAFAEPAFKRPVDPATADRRAGEILARMAMDEKVQVISGFNHFFLHEFPQYGIPELALTDATQGIRLSKKDKRLEKSTAFPAAIALSATWNPALAARYAEAVGEECRAGGFAVLLGPGLNIYRQSQSGRGFEYFGEDPYLTGQMVAGYVRGMLRSGTMPVLKHFLANNTDHHRRRSDSVVDERTLHEIYMPGFEAGIAAGAPAVMTSYNLVNGEWAGQSDYVITQLLRKDLGFTGLVMTDWRAVWDAEKVIKSGLDLEMPLGETVRPQVMRLLEEGKVTPEDIDRMARSVLRTCISMGFYDRPIKDASYLEKFPAHEQVALQTAREGIVLLKNNGVLPLAENSARKILLTGLFLDQVPMGGGAGKVTGYNNVTLRQALTETFGSRLESATDATDEEIKAADVVLVSTGTLDRESSDRSFVLPPEEEARIKHVLALNPRSVVIVNSGGGIQMTGWNEQAAAILYAWYPGQIGNRAVGEILAGVTNPSGKLPITIERSFADSPGYGYAPAGEPLDGEPRISVEMTRPIQHVQYKEGVFVGYRWYDSKGIVPLYHFGHGLSYTTFSYEDLKISRQVADLTEPVEVACKVTNTGKVAGAEVVQLYVRDLKASVPRPDKELKHFARIVLAPGESQVVKFSLGIRDFAFWDVTSHGWKAEAGDYLLLIGGASDRANLKGKIELK